MSETGFWIQHSECLRDGKIYERVQPRHAVLRTHSTCSAGHWVGDLLGRNVFEHGQRLLFAQFEKTE